MTMHTTDAACKFCGQAMVIEIDIDKFQNMSNAEKMEHVNNCVIENCKCEKARNKRKEILHKNFKGFVHGDLASFLDKFELEEISVKTSDGFKGKVKKDKVGNLKIETTINEVV